MLSPETRVSSGMPRFEPPAPEVRARPDTKEREWPHSQTATLFALLVFSAVIRLVKLGVFPLVEADEGLWTNSTKNFLRFGDWFMDGRTHLFLSPVFHALTLPVFALNGASIVGARLVSVAAGVMSVWLIYRLIMHETARRDHALLAALVMGVSHWAVLTSRKAMIEPVELCALLAAADFLVRRGAWQQVVGGCLLGVALLTKLNAAFMLPVAGLYLLMSRPSSARAAASTWSLPRHVVVAGLPLAIAVAVAALVYWPLYATHPVQFTSAFRFELDGVHFDALSHPIVRLGRFGVDPLQEAKTVIEMFRDSPFVIVLAVLGVLVGIVERPAGSRLFALWLGIGLPFFLGQMLQPVRYFYLLMPAFAYFASLALIRLGTVGEISVGAGRMTRLTAAAAATFLTFELAYAGASAAANREHALPTVVDWVTRETRPTDAIMAAGYYATDLPNRAYAHYRLARDTTQLLESIRKYDIRYVIVDNIEWRADLRAVVAEKYVKVAEWPFGAAYRVAPAR